MCVGIADPRFSVVQCAGTGRGHISRSSLRLEYGGDQVNPDGRPEPGPAGPSPRFGTGRLRLPQRLLCERDGIAFASVVSLADDRQLGGALWDRIRSGCAGTQRYARLVITALRASQATPRVEEPARAVGER